MGTITRTFPAQATTLTIGDGERTFDHDYTVEATAAIDVMLPRVQTSRHAGEAGPTLIIRNTGDSTITLRSADGATVDTVAAGEVATLRPTFTWDATVV